MQNCRVLLYSFISSYNVYLIQFYLLKVDAWLDNLALAGATLAGIVFVTGAANVVIMVTLWILYHSFVNIGETTLLHNYYF